MGHIVSRSRARFVARPLQNAEAELSKGEDTEQIPVQLLKVSDLRPEVIAEKCQTPLSSLSCRSFALEGSMVAPVCSMRSAKTSKSLAPLGKRHLILNFDVNCTIIMTDKVQGLSEEDVANTVLASAAWGVENDDQWVLVADTPSVHRPAASASQCSQELVNYNEYVEKRYPGCDDKEKRKEMVRCFTKVREPGEKLAQYASMLVDKLQSPDGSGMVLIIPAFFELLTSLKQEGRSFTLVFRTFGDDLKAVITELNAFCEGRHPMSRHDLRFDGSDGGPDYRVQPLDINRCGTIYRDAESTSLIMGTWWQPEFEKEPNLTCYHGMKGIVIETGSLDMIGTKIRQMCKKPGTLALRDCFLYWKRQGFMSSGGKPLFYKCSRKSGLHEIFFDDNIRFADAFIVQAVDMVQPNKQQWTTPLLRTHLCRSEPLEAIVYSDYFIRELARLENAYEVKLTAREMLVKVVKYAAELRRQHRISKLRYSHMPQAAAEDDSAEKYDAWQYFRVDNRRISVREVDEHEGAY